MSWLKHLHCGPAKVLDDSLSAAGVATLSGRWGSSTLALLAWVAQQRPHPRLLVTAHLDEADQALDVLQRAGLQAVRFPAIEVLPGESDARMDLRGERLRVIRGLLQEAPAPRVLVAPVAALMQPIPDISDLQTLYRVLESGDVFDREGLLAWLIEAGFRRSTTVEQPGEFALRGDILDVFPESGEPIRIDCFGDVIEELRAIDLDSMGSGRVLKHVDLVACGARFEDAPSIKDARWVVELLDPGTEAIFDDLDEIHEQARSYLERVDDGSAIAPLKELLQSLQEQVQSVVLVRGPAMAGEVDGTLDVGTMATFSEQAPRAVDDLRSRAQEDDVLVLCEHPKDEQRLRELLGSSSAPRRLRIVQGLLPRGFTMQQLGNRTLQVVPWHEVIHRYSIRRRTHGTSGERAMDAFVQIKPDDLVVHRDHGIARFLGLREELRDGLEGRREECLVLEFARGSRLYVPAGGIEKVQRYVGAFKGIPELSVLGAKAWKRRTEAAGDAVKELAGELLRVQATRAAQAGSSCGPDGEWQAEFEAAFEFEETDDQRVAIESVARDMCSVRPMDRLVCGDVGFGKTEIAVRGAFRTAAAGRQVAILVPTTVLAEQHERTFRRRFAGYPFRIESISRFKTPAEQKVVLQDLVQGKVDVIIGTHRLLSADVLFRDLGLVVIDEEQRFGVEHKQRLLGLRATVDVLTLTATPIPRTLHMSMVGLRDISSLQTAPVDRQAVVTEVLPFDEKRVQSALRRELAREGQAFVVHNRVKDLQDIADIIARLVPGARVISGHGQMAPRELEKAMLTFLRRQADILVCTTIIESGIDIPTANTIIINEADRYGLADLHQLRGRVGRSSHRGYCYLLLPTSRTVNPDARRRLQAMESFAMLGAGFRIALRDLEIRGAGNILGPEQSGHIAAVGYELYCRLLEQAVDDLRTGRTTSLEKPDIDPGFSGWVPSAWIPGDVRRMDAYRRIARANSVPDLDDVVSTLATAYGVVPDPAQRFIDLAELGIRCMANGILAVVRRDDDLIFRTCTPLHLETLMDGVQGKFRRVGTPSAAGVWECWWRPGDQMLQPATLCAVLRKRLPQTQLDQSVQAGMAAGGGVP